MSKNRFWIALCSLLIGVVLIAQAQDTPPLTQPTLDAQVATLLAQTQTAVVPHQTEIAATHAVQAALAQALTATAQALLPTATPTSEAFQAAALSLAGTTEIDLKAIHYLPAPPISRRMASISPTLKAVPYACMRALSSSSASPRTRCRTLSLRLSVGRRTAAIWLSTRISFSCSLTRTSGCGIQ